MKSGAFQNVASASTLARSQTRPSWRILLVDDDMFILQVNAAVLGSFGYQTRTAKDGAAAWEALQSNGYDLLITDNNTPSVSGIELVKKVRSARMTLPVILASGDLPTLKLDANAWLQPFATLRKPFTDDQLLGTVKKVFARATILASKPSRCPARDSGS